MLLTELEDTREVMSFNAKKINEKAQVFNGIVSFQSQEEGINGCKGGRCYNDVLKVN